MLNFGLLCRVVCEKNVYLSRGPLVFKGGYHARVQNRGKRVVFSQRGTYRPVGVKNGKNQEKGHVFFFFFFLRLMKSM